MKALRIDHVTVVSRDVPAARTTFQRAFGFDGAPAGEHGDAALAIGDARIEFVAPAAGTALAATLAAHGEGLAAITIEVADLDEAAAQLRTAGVRFTRETLDDDAIVVDPAAAHGVPLRLAKRR